MKSKFWTILFLIIFFPINLWSMWKHEHFPKAVRVIITVFFIIIALFTACSDDNKDKQTALEKKEEQLKAKELELEKHELCTKHHPSNLPIITVL